VTATTQLLPLGNQINSNRESLETADELSKRTNFVFLFYEVSGFPFFFLVRFRFSTPYFCSETERSTKN
jgi:hypothetical protein